MEARFETIAGKKLNIEEKMDIVLSWLSEEAPPVIKGSLDANEDIGVVEVSRAIDDVFDIGESNVESMEVRSEFNEFLENKESVKEVVVGGGEVCGVGEDELNRVISALKDGGGEFDGHLDEINLNLSEELTDNGVSPIPTSLVAHESPQVRQLWERIGIGDAQGLMENERNHKFVQPNVWGWMPDSQSAYSSYHLEGKVVEGGRGKKVLVAVAEGRRTTGVEKMSSQDWFIGSMTNIGSILNFWHTPSYYFNTCFTCALIHLSSLIIPKTTIV
ncbi:hypothetical protein Tco_0781562 [Tanacetum coccineum]